MCDFQKNALYDLMDSQATRAARYSELPSGTACGRCDISLIMNQTRATGPLGDGGRFGVRGVRAGAGRHHQLERGVCRADSTRGVENRGEEK